MNKVERDLLEVLKRAETMDRFLRLTSPEVGYSLNQAANFLGKSPSYFSGENSMLARYKRAGAVGLLPPRRLGKHDKLIKRILVRLCRGEGDDCQ